MAERDKPCPRCGARMSLRLGQWECPGCGHTLEAAPPPPPPDEKPMDYGGVKRVKLLTSAPPPPPAGARASFDPLTGDLEGRTPGYTGSVYRPPPSGPAPASLGLMIEKHIYFGLSILGLLFWIYVTWTLANVSAQTTLLGSPHQGEDSMIRGMMLFTLIFGMIIGLFFTWYALYGPAVWAKWACLGWAVLGLIGIAISALTGGGMMGLLAALGPDAGAGAAVARFVSVVVAAAIQLWFMSIIYRDIQRLQGTSEY